MTLISTVNLLLSSLTVVGQVKVGQRPWGIALSPDGRFLYTANGPSGDVSIINITAGSVRMRVARSD